MNAGNFIQSDEKSDCPGVEAAVLSRSPRPTGSYAREDTRPYTFLPDGQRPQPQDAVDGVSESAAP